MTESIHELPVIQRWMQAVIMHPSGAEAGLKSPSAQQHIAVDAATLDHVVCRSRKQTSIERMQIYANAYYARLLECLRDEFRGMVHALGEEAFDGFAFAYLQSYPSQSYTLNNLAGRLPEFLRETRPEDINADTPAWPDFLIDLATLERTYHEVFDGPGIESSRILAPEDLVDFSLDDFAYARLIPVPCLRLLRLRYPVHEYISAVAQKKQPEVPPPVPTNLAITRRDYVVRRTAVSDVQYELLSALAAGEPVGATIERVADMPDVNREKLAGEIRTWFRDWAASAYFQAIEKPLSVCDNRPTTLTLAQQDGNQTDMGISSVSGCNCMSESSPRRKCR